MKIKSSSFAVQIALFAGALFFSFPAFADCQNFPNFSGTYQGGMSDSNYAVSATVTHAPDCSSISVHFYGVDRDYTIKYELGPAAATVDNGVIHTMASLHDYSSVYLLNTDTASNNPQSQPVYARLTVLSLTTANQLDISFLGGLLITFEGTRAAK